MDDELFKQMMSKYFKIMDMDESKMIKLPITITSNHILWGIKDNSCNCPLALAIRDALRKYDPTKHWVVSIDVNSYVVECETQVYFGKSIDEWNQFILDFDNSVRPILTPQMKVLELIPVE